MNFFDTLYLRLRGSLTEMDSRFRGNDVISARCVTFTLAVIPAQAGSRDLLLKWIPAFSPLPRE